MKYIPIDVLKVYLALGDTKLEVGRLALIRRKIYFEYTPSFIATGIQGWYTRTTEFQRSTTIWFYVQHNF